MEWGFKLRQSESRSWVPNHYTVLMTNWLLLLCLLYKRQGPTCGLWVQFLFTRVSHSFQMGSFMEPAVVCLCSEGSAPFLLASGQQGLLLSLPRLEVVTEVTLERFLKAVLWLSPWRCPTLAHHRTSSRASCWHSFLTFGRPSWHPFSPGGLAAFQACWWICLTL